MLSLHWICWDKSLLVPHQQARRRSKRLSCASWPWWELGGCCVILGSLCAWDGASWAVVAKAVACQPARIVFVGGCVTQGMCKFRAVCLFHVDTAA